MFIKRLFAKATLDLFKNTIKIDPNFMKIEPKASRIHPVSTFQYQVDARSTPEVHKIDFEVILECVWELKIGCKTPKFHENPKKFSKTFLHANLV